MKKTSFWLLIFFLMTRVNAQTIYFPPTSGNQWDTIAPQTLGYCQPKIDSLYNFWSKTTQKHLFS